MAVESGTAASETAATEIEETVSTASNKRPAAAAAPAIADAPSEPLSAAERAAGIMCVKLGKKFGNRIFHEFDEAHPHDAGQHIGEALVVGGRVVKVAPTARVREALARGILEEVRSGLAHPQLPDLIDAVNAKVVPSNGVPNGTSASTPTTEAAVAPSLTLAASSKATK